MQIIDISQPYPGCRIYPGDSAPKLRRVSEIAEAKPSYNISDMSFCLHNGTHIDAPLHTDPHGLSAAELPLSVYLGKATVAEASGNIGAAEVRKILSEKESKRLLLKGGGCVTAEGARELVKSKILLIGTEGVSVSAGGDEYEVHRTLLDAGVAILEGLELRHAAPGMYLLSALPLKIENADAAPCRAVLLF